MMGEEPTNINPLQKLRAVLHAKAKSAPNFRFYSLYDKVYRRDVLEAAYVQCRVNDGCPAWTASPSRTSRGTAWTDGWTN